MEWAIFYPYFQNASLLLLLSVLLEVIYIIPQRLRRTRLVVLGIVAALICLAIMSVPYTLMPGLWFDTRSILISVVALAFGPIPTAITVFAAFLYRALLGGVGMLPGLAVIVSCAAIGLGWRRFLNPRLARLRWLNIFFMSMTVHVVMLACMLPLPYPDNVTVIRAIALPVLTIYPVTASMLSLLLMRQQETHRLQENLKQSEERFRALFDQAPLGYQSLNADGVVEDINGQWLAMFGYARADVVGQPFAKLLSPESLEGFHGKFAEFKARGHIRCDMVMLAKSGQERYIHFEGKIRYGGAGEVLQAHCILQDVTDQHRAQENLRASEEKYFSYIKNAPDAILIMNREGNIVEVNDTATDITGYAREELLTFAVADFVDSQSRALGDRLFEDLLTQDMVSGQLEYRHQNGTIRWANISAVKLSDNRFLCFMSDCSEQKWAENKLIYQSNHDDLTGLYNRRFFDMEAKRLDAEEFLPLSILMVDINGVKLINDSFGRAEGDRIIRETARFIAGFCRPGDVLARTGGDEFSYLLPKTDSDAAAILLASIQFGCGEYNKRIADDALHIQLALGSATRAGMDESVTELFKNAENSMNQRKLLDQRSSHSSIISTIKATMREKSHETEAHEERIARLARRVGEILGLAQIDLDYMELLAELHDIGKVGVNEQILNKPGRLTDEEWVEMRKHPEIGERIALSTPTLAPIANYILCHHERWDGSGYPQKLKGYEIPLLSRILTIVDAYDAMTQDRVYQKAMSHQDALAEIQRNAGAQFDPQLARIFCEDVFKDRQP